MGQEKANPLEEYDIERLANEIISRCSAAVVLVITANNAGCDYIAYRSGNRHTCVGMLHVAATRLTQQVVDEHETLSDEDDDDDDTETVT